MEDKIDFVITWVDGFDQEWQRERDIYRKPALAKGPQSSDCARYEDLGLLRFWFRGVEQFASWVNKIHFITWGHVPNWLNTDHPKLNIVKHSDYIPQEYLPTFSSHPIELNFHRIKDLSEEFVYFNDDTFLLQTVRPTDFFKRGLPRATAGLLPFRIAKGDGLYFPLNNVAVINDHFSFRKSILTHFGKWFNGRYGAMINFVNFLMVLFPAFYGFNEQHLPNSFLKTTYKTIWTEEPDILDETSRHRFRDSSDVSQWLIENWQFASGCFAPRSSKFGRAFHLSGDISHSLPELIQYIERRKGKVVCINDGVLSPENTEIAKKAITDSFRRLMPAASSFELF